MELNREATNRSTTPTKVVSWNNRSDIFRYDRDGNLIEGLLPGDIPFSADYDAESRLTKIQFAKDGKQIEERFRYGYDHFLRRYERYEKDTQVIAKDFVRFGLLELQERDEEGNVVAQNAWRPDLAGGVGGLLVRRQGESHYYCLTNHLGYVQGVFNQQGQRIGQYDYSPYGLVGGSNSDLQPFGMSTKRSDFASGLVYFGYRFYMPNLGRWLNRDPLQEQGGINLYAYVNGDPLGYIDPDGRFVLVIPPPPLPIGLPINQMTGNSPNNGWIDSPEASLMHDYYKNSCGPKLPPSGDECQDYRNEANQASMCAHLRSQWDDRFWPGRHTKAIMDSQRRAKKYNRLADDCERAREVMNCQ